MSETTTTEKQEQNHEQERLEIAADIAAGSAPDMAELETHVATRDFSVFYDDNEAVAKISLEMPRGQVTAIIGPSGCGKSTFLRAINRMNDLIPNCTVQGEMALDGYDVYGADLDVVILRQRVGMMFQKPNPFPKSTFDNVAYGPRLLGVRKHSELA